jgi:hypothetical protein
MSLSGNIDALFLTNTSSLTSEIGSIRNWIRLKLGEPVLTVELQNEQIDAFVEESIIEFSSEISKFKAKNSYLSLIGIKKTTNVQTISPMPSLNFIKRYVAQFGTDGNAGGNVNYNKAYFNTESGQTTYNLRDTLKDVNTNSSISLTGMLIPKMIYHSPTNGNYRYFDPMYGSNFFLYNEFSNKDAYAINSRMLYSMPLYEHLLRFQWFQNFDKLFKSQYKWNIIGENITLSPKPGGGIKIYVDWIDSVVLDETYGNYLSHIDENSLSAFTTDVTDIPFNNLLYEKINDFSKNWIRQYSLALSKETLGLIRGKMLSLPIPDAEVTLNYAELTIEGKEKQQSLKAELKEFLDSIVSSEALKREGEILDIADKYLNKTPISKIYIK